jgi:hypothetical protein
VLPVQLSDEAGDFITTRPTTSPRALTPDVCRPTSEALDPSDSPTSTERPSDSPLPTPDIVPANSLLPDCHSVKVSVPSVLRPFQPAGVNSTTAGTVIDVGAEPPTDMHNTFWPDPVASIKLYVPAVRGGWPAATDDEGAAVECPPHPAAASASVTAARGISHDSREAHRVRHP